MTVRVLLWLWLTLLLTVATAYAVTRYVSEDDTFSTLSPDRSASLAAVAEQVALRINRPLLLKHYLRQASEEVNASLFLYDARSARLLPADIPMPRRDVKSLLRSLSENTSPLQLNRRGLVITGPFLVETDTSSLRMFAISHHDPSLQRLGMFAALAAVLVVTLLLAYFFTRTLVAPIKALTELTTKVATGQWQQRESKVIQRQDELGFLAREFNFMLDQLHQARHQQQRLLADISHELRSPLARLQMAVALLHQAPTAELLQRVEHEVERIDAMIGDILLFSRAEMSGLKKESLTLNELLSPIIDAAMFDADTLHKRLSVTFDGERPICVDRVAITRAIDNLLRNALRYAQQQITLEVRFHGEHWCLTVEDDGHSVPEAELTAIFRPFYRVAAARDAASGGTGLGLAIVQAAVLSHAGTVEASRSAMGGLLVTITMPLQEANYAVAME